MRSCLGKTDCKTIIFAQIIQFTPYILLINVYNPKKKLDFICQI